MSMEFYSGHHIKRTRKPHACEFCWDEIPKGSGAFYESGKYDGDLFQRYTCPTCMPFTSGFWDYCDGESSDTHNDFAEYIRDRQLPHPKFTVGITCPSCGPVRVRDTDYDDGLCECPKCGTTLEVEE